ncbi:MAG: transglutaminase domain-containing protein, partial [Paludibacteraceae bacterium]
FDKCTCGVVYLPFYYSEGKIIPFSYPHLLRADNSVEKLQPDYKNKRTVIIEEQENYLKFRTNKKYTLLYWDKKWNRVNTLIAGTEKKLIFNNVPANALLLLLPEYSQGKERPFIINNDGVREWW